jgi:putative lipoprotein
MSSAIRNPGAALAVMFLLAGCQTSGGNAPAESAEASLTGTVSYRERMALPPDAKVEVRLEDVSRADAPASVIAEQRIDTEGRQLPIPFDLRYARDRIEPNHRYALRAEIRGADGALLFATATQHAVLTEGAASENIAIQMQMVPVPRVVSNPLIGDWRLIAIQRAGAAEEAVGPEPAYTMTFSADGRVTGKAHCNSYGGSYEQPATGQLRTRNVISTLMACMTPSRADEFLSTIGAVDRYEIDGTELRLMSGDGSALKLDRQTATAGMAPQAKRPWADAARRGIKFRALGNEPSWVLEVTDKQLTMITDLGERRTEFPLAKPVMKGETTIWRSAGAGEGLVAVVQRARCVDGMSGEEFEASAAATFEGQTYRGCGRFLK